MPSPFAAQTMPLGQLFATPNILHVPPYQRSFAWTDEEAGRLLDDLAGAFEAEGEANDYFLGTMLFTEAGKSALRPLLRTPRVLEVVDGLQRLTTLTILFSILRDFDQEDGERPSERMLAAIGTGPGGTGRRRLELRGADEIFFQAHVRGRGATHVQPDDEELSPAETRMLKVREHLLEALAEYDPPQRRRFADFLLDKCHVVVLVATAGMDRAHRMFTVLNATGKPLARNDILKADLLGSVPTAALARTTAAWDDAEVRLGGDFESLFSHIRTVYSRSSVHVISGIKEIAAQQGGSAAFIERILQPAAAAFDDIRHARHTGSPHSRAIVTSLRYLGWLRGGDWVPPAMLWWLEKGRDAAELAWFLGALDRLAYGLRLLGIGTRRRANRFWAVVQAIRQGEDLKSVDGPLNLTRAELRTIHHNLRDLHARSAPMAKLVLLRLNDHAAGSPQNLAMEDLTVEHLLPRKPGANSVWRTLFPEAAERDQCTESLGNLVLMTRAQNDRAGNLDFARKKEVLFKAGTTQPLPINDYVRRQTDWRATQILDREAEVLHRLDQLWAIGPPPGRGDAAARARRQGRTSPEADARR
jgi:Protein of unknown function DUF262/Protein of unknown function (DUF1524)